MVMCSTDVYDGIGRLDDVTTDAELQEKSAADVKYMVDTLLSQCQQAVKEHEQKNKDAVHAQQPAESTAAGGECMLFILVCG